MLVLNTSQRVLVTDILIHENMTGIGKMSASPAQRGAGKPARDATAGRTRAATASASNAATDSKSDRQLDEQTVDRSELLDKMEAAIAEKQRSFDQRCIAMQKQSREETKQLYQDLLAEFESDINKKLEQHDQKFLKLQKDMAASLEKQSAMQEEISQLKDRLESSHICSTSQTSGPMPTPDRSWPSPAAPSGEWQDVVSRVSRLTDCKMQEMDLADQEARKKKELNAVLRNFEQEAGETPASLKKKVDELLTDQLEASAACVSAKRMQKGRNDAAKGIVVVQFEKKQHKVAVFKARSKLTGTTIGLDDDLTHLQQQRKNAAWPAFKDFKSKGVRTQWRAEKLFVKEGERFVEHKVLNL